MKKQLPSLFALSLLLCAFYKTPDVYWICDNCGYLNDTTSPCNGCGISAEEIAEGTEKAERGQVDLIYIDAY